MEQQEKEMGIKTRRYYAKLRKELEDENVDWVKRVIRNNKIFYQKQNGDSDYCPNNRTKHFESYEEALDFIKEGKIVFF